MKVAIVIGILAASISAGAQSSTAVAPVPAPQATLKTDLVSASNTKKTKLSVTTGLLGRSLEDRYVNSKYAGGTINLNGSHRIADNLEARMAMGFILSAGSYSNLYGGEGSAPNAVYVDEAALAYKPISALSLEAGVILTQFSTMPSNMESMGFPSLRQTLEMGNGDYKAQLFATQAIPTSDTAAVQATQSGITTTLLMYGIGGTTNAQDLGGLTLSGSVGRFQFENLNASAASDSQTLGNSVDGGGGPQARFRYEFEGTELGAKVAYRFKNGLKTSLSGALLRNEKAPEEKNKGYLYSVGASLPLGLKEVSASLGYFYNEEDTLPASYTSTGKGSNNRFGQVARIGMSNSKEAVSGFLQYTRANEIVNKPFTADRDIIVLGLEIGYDVL
ncbi:MAG: hypothetical protein KF789_02580 [Bdellovibrionaceae bacterium]|nr:hypothetical protein [Pseudobdellovibrionaceae bacterium]